MTDGPIEGDGGVLGRALDEMPIEYRERFESLAVRPARTHSALVADLAEYTGTVRQVSAFVTSIDPDVADAIARSCRALLDRYTDGPAAGLVSALVTYFVEEEEDHEITGVLGFDDDIQVVNAVCRVLGSTDLALPLSRR